MNAGGTAARKVVAAVPVSAPSHDMSRPIPPEHAAFIAEWNQIEPTERRRVRRLVRTGQPLESPGEARLAVGFAAFQRSRPWARYFWLWFVPGVLVALTAAAGIHPVLIGVILASGGSALLARRNLKRVAKVNAGLLGDISREPPPSGAVAGS